MPEAVAPQAALRDRAGRHGPGAAPSPRHRLVGHVVAAAIRPASERLQLDRSRPARLRRVRRPGRGALPRRGRRRPRRAAFGSRSHRRRFVRRTRGARAGPAPSAAGALARALGYDPRTRDLSARRLAALGARTLRPRRRAASPGRRTRARNCRARVRSRRRARRDRAQHAPRAAGRLPLRDRHHRRDRRIAMARVDRRAGAGRLRRTRYRRRPRALANDRRTHPRRAPRDDRRRRSRTQHRTPR